MATSNPPSSGRDADGDADAVGIAHPTVVPVNFEGGADSESCPTCGRGSDEE